MLNRQNCFDISRAGNQLLTGSKWDNSRSLRRFLADVVLPTVGRAGSSEVFQCFAFDEGYNSEQLAQLESYAQYCVEDQAPCLDDVSKLVTFKGTLVDEMFGSVFNHYMLPWVPATASLKELQFMVRIVIEIAYGLHRFAGNVNGEALATCPTYCMRNLPCNIQPDSLLWCIGGQDKQGGSGVLEWCYDEQDAGQVLASMSRFPERFTNLSATRFLQKSVSA